MDDEEKVNALANLIKCCGYLYSLNDEQNRDDNMSQLTIDVARECLGHALGRDAMPEEVQRVLEGRLS